MPRGRPQKVTDKELLAVAKSLRGPSFTAAEVAAEIDIGAETTRGRLDTLVEEGVLAAKMPSSEKIYWLRGAVGVTETGSEATP
jgi:predicted ArsR family transcriptional regulator